MQPGCSRVITTSRRGRRLVYIFLFAISGLSTHDLTQRSTALYLYSASSFLLSTHDLTQRSTCSYSSVPHTIGPFNSRPHAEVDFVCCSYFYPLSPFNSRPHAEVDMQLDDGTIEKIRLSTHDLTQRSTTAWSTRRTQTIFQLTTSRRGRRGKLCFR